MTSQHCDCRKESSGGLSELLEKQDSGLALSDAEAGEAEGLVTRRARATLRC